MIFVDFNGSWVFLYLFIFLMILRPRTTENGHSNEVWLCAMRAPWSSWLSLSRAEASMRKLFVYTFFFGESGGSMESFISLSVILKLFLHTDFHAKNETGKFISVIRMVRVTRPLICHTFKLNPSLSEFTPPCELLFSCVFIVHKTNTKTTNNFSSRLWKSCILKWLDNCAFYLSSTNLRFHKNVLEDKGFLEMFDILNVLVHFWRN